MRVVVGCVGHWVHLWRGLFSALCRRGDLQLDVLTCGAEPATWRLCQECEACHPSLSMVNCRAHFSWLGHMAAWTFPPGVGRLVGRLAPDVIYSIGEISYASTYQLARAKTRHAPGARLFVYGAQNIGRSYPPPFSHFERQALRTMDHLFPVGAEAEQVVRDKGYRGPATRLPLGVDDGLFQRAEDPGDLRRQWGLSGFVVGYVGRLTPVKGVDLLVRALAALDKSVTALIVGHGPLQGDLEALAAELGVSARVRFAGGVSQTELPGLYSCMDAFVLPSRQVLYSQRQYGLGLSPVKIGLKEQFGRVLVEAMACRTPVIGSSSGEIPAVIGDAGLVFEEDSAEGLAAAIETYRRSPETAQAMAQRGYERAMSQYTWDVIAGRMVAAWREAVGDRG